LTASRHPLTRSGVDKGRLRFYWRDYQDTSAPESSSGPLARRPVRLVGARRSAVQHLRRFPIHRPCRAPWVRSARGRLRACPVADYVSRDSSKPAPHLRCRRPCHQALGTSHGNLSEGE
jgi:hypothetical protein